MSPLKSGPKYSALQAEQADEAIVQSAETVQDCDGQQDDDAPVAVPVGSEAEDAITVKVKSTDDKTHDVRVSASSSVLEFKELLEAITGLPSDRQRLICLGKLLVDEKTLLDSSVKDGNFVHLVPKPARSGGSRPTAVGPSNAGQDELRLPAHIREMFAENGRSSSFTGDSSGADFESEYELSIWRYRVRVMSMVMLFYYTLSLMASLTTWTSILTNTDGDESHEYPREGQFHQVKTDIPLTIVDTLENTLGVFAALEGMKCATSFAHELAKEFSRNMVKLTVVHFLNLFMWISALTSGEIVAVPTPSHHSRQSNREVEESVPALVGTMLIVHPLMWISMLMIAFRYHKCLLARQETLQPDESEPVAPSSLAVV
mmetsp:Transcript_23388/g.41373  ORF Transcript_23388/g.41373 Transcript_23388/m.41373 type:complete len:374 (-) Transcript_23388:149-1270(-)